MAETVEDQGEIRFRAACYNIHRSKGPDRRLRPKRAAQVIEEIDAAIVGLQEVDWHAQTGPQGASQAAFLAHLEGYEAIEGPNIVDHRGHYGNMLLTRFPVRQVTLTDLTVGRREPRGVIDAELDCAGLGVRVLVTHLGLGMRERRMQVAKLYQMIMRSPDQPTLLLGDLNDWIAGSPTLARLLRSADGTGAPKSFPSFFPLLALDRIVSWGGGRTLSVHAHRSRAARWASDHLPAVADIVFPHRADPSAAALQQGYARPHIGEQVAAAESRA